MSKEKRQDERHDLRVRMDYRPDDRGNFLFEYTMNISEGGIFIETTTPLPVGTTVEMRFQPPSSSEVIEVVGKVVWVNPVRDDDDNPNPGMGIQFTGLDDDHKDLIAQVVRTIAYL